ncbi:MAG: glycosyltransferase [Stellaceae bacterium]
MTGCVLFYVQHLLGIGHLQRALRIAGALKRERLRVTLVSGGEPVATLANAPADQVIQLPPVRAKDAGFKELVDHEGRPVDDRLRGARRSALLAVFAAVQPEVILIEAFPFGRRAFRFELDALIDAAWSHRPRPLLVCSLRDIVVAPHDPLRLRDIVDRVRAKFDFVLVHGDPNFLPLEASFPAATEIADQLIYTGYIGETNGTCADQHLGTDEAVGRDEVIVSVGGGAVGGTLLSTALETRRRGVLADVTWRLLAGPNLPEAEFRILRSGLPEGIILERYRLDFPQLLRRCRVSISQAGYNTILDLLKARAAAVVIPFAAQRETEQSLRAERLAARGMLELIRETELSPETLASAIDRVIGRRPAMIPIATEGARRTAALIAEMIRKRRLPTGSGILSRGGQAV